MLVKLWLTWHFEVLRKYQMG